MNTHHYLHLDVFTDSRFSGNPLAVFPDASGIPDYLMQRIANEIGFSETTFVLPRESADTDVRMRIFTPAHEMPIAGHPTVGSTFALAFAERIESGREHFTFGLGAGPTPVTLEWRGEALEFVWMRQPVPRYGPVVEDVAAVAAALGVAGSDIRDTGMPVEMGSAGVPFLYVPMASRAAVDASALDLARMRAAFAAAGLDEAGVFVFSTGAGDPPATAYSRMFAPGLGVAEDPATGIASGPLGGYLVRHGAVAAEQAGGIVSLQGAYMGRPSHVHIRVETGQGEISGVQVGGCSVLVAEGSMRV